MDLSWQAPDSDGGSDITGYTVQYREATGSWDTPADVSEETVTGITHTLTGLTGGVEYTLRVIAVNGVGDGPPSADVSATPKQEEKPTWSATLTAGTLSDGHGYDIVFNDPPVGSLSETTIDLEDDTYTVKTIAAGWFFYIGLDKELPFDFGFTIQVDGVELDSGDATLTSFSWGHVYKWEEAEIEWQDGDTVELRLLPAD